MYRYFLTIEYDGTPFVGWQYQSDGLSVQGVLEKAISQLDGREVRVHGAGRTDAGVHARGQVAHLDLLREREPRVVQNAVNAMMFPYPVTVLSVRRVEADMDARFSAIRRHYLYRLSDRGTPLALDRKRVWHRPCANGLNVEAMQMASELLIGYHDFTTFRASGCQAKSPWRSVQSLEVSRIEDEIRISISARSFLHTQVRSIVGSLWNVGVGKWRVSDLEAALSARDRRRCGLVAPPHGLYLVAVEY